MALQLMDRVKWSVCFEFDKVFEATLIGLPKDHPFHLIGWEKDEPNGGWGRDINKTYTDTEMERRNYLSPLITWPSTRFVFARWVDEKDLTKINQQTSVKAFAGLNCKGCNEHFPFAAPNQSDGTFACWSCKRYPFYR